MSIAPLLKPNNLKIYADELDATTASVAAIATDNLTVADLTAQTSLVVPSGDTPPAVTAETPKGTIFVRTGATAPGIYVPNAAGDGWSGCDLTLAYPPPP